MDERHDLSGRFRCRSSEHARVIAADGRSPSGREKPAGRSGRRILDIDREVAGTLRDVSFPTENFGVPLAGSLIPWIDRGLDNGQTREEWKGQSETNKILGRSDHLSSSRWNLRSRGRHALPQSGVDDQVEEGCAAGRDRGYSLRFQQLGASCSERSREHVEGVDAGCGYRVIDDPVGRLRKLAMGGEYLSAFTVGDQLLWGAAEPLRRMLRLLVQA